MRRRASQVENGEVDLERPEEDEEDCGELRFCPSGFRDACIYNVAIREVGFWF